MTSSMSQAAVDQQQQQPASSAAAAASAITQQHPAPPVVRITLASLEECNVLLHNGLDFYGATFFPVEAASPVAFKKKPMAPNRYRTTHNNIILNVSSRHYEFSLRHCALTLKETTKYVNTHS